MAIKLDGKLYSRLILDEIKAEVSTLVEKGMRPPCLTVLVVGRDPASDIYISNNITACNYVGITPQIHDIQTKPGESRNDSLLAHIDYFNKNFGTDGILIPAPLPSDIDEQKASLCLEPAKDVDGFHPCSVGLMDTGMEGLAPCTPAGIVELLRRGGVAIKGKHCVVVGRSNVVGKPTALLLLRENATITICHSMTKDLGNITRQADILVAALNKKWLIKPDMIKEGAVVVDAGIHKTPGDTAITGDVDPACWEKAAFMTPVPGGVGPMTVAMLMKNCLTAYRNLRRDHIRL